MTNPFEAFDAEPTEIKLWASDLDAVLTTEHATSSYGYPVLLDTQTDIAYGAGDNLPSGDKAWQFVRRHPLGIGSDLVRKFIAMAGEKPHAWVDGITGDRPAV